ncbi:cytoplasmic protein [Candidatus Nitrospira bockiana]
MAGFSSKRPGAQPGARRARQESGDFRAFRASLLYCPTCRQATPTRERLLLVLPTGNLYEYLCAQCGTSTGSKTDKEAGEVRLVLP